MFIAEIHKLTSSIDGFLQRDEGPLLYFLTKKVTKGCIVEIGSWKGKSTVWIAKGIIDMQSLPAGRRGKIPFYAIDPHTGSKEHQSKKKKVWTYDIFKTNMKKAEVTSVVTPLVMTSELAVKKVKKPVEFIFIDGDHDYEMVKKDFELWFPKVIDGGVMAFHDTTNWDGPKRLTRDKVYFSSHFKNVRFIQSITYGTKVDQNTFKERLHNRYVYYLKTLYGTTSTLPFPRSTKRLGRKLLFNLVKR